MRFNSKVRLSALVGGALAAVVLLTACGGGESSGAGAESTTEPPQAPVEAAAASGPGTIAIRSTEIRGQEGRILLVFVTGDGGGPIARACIRVESDSFTAGANQLTDAPTDDPCGGETEVTTFPEGSYSLSAGIYTPPGQEPDKQVTMTVEVSGDVEVVLDGDGLSR